ncbi:phosphoglycolate phosphatase [Amphritea atlantica]|uniref:Phosphoglycolate phosphatase n=1 Tax=Amphritea atlantica TaxID=355243 RepID=A0A1H9M7U2_9GAMM|nr:phosphoglycolate phosphatase [Amphritea atlantica]SER19748.1 phosphoglycolate phosphatase [Amphritea atlantica]
MLLSELYNPGLPQLVLFDLDGTLLDSVPDLALAIDRMLAALDLPMAGQSRVRHWVGNGAQMLVKRALAHATGVEESDLFDQAFTLFLHHYGLCCAEQSKLYPGVEALLTFLRDNQVSMGLVTNKPIGFTERLLDEYDLRRFFSIVLGGDSLAEKKPHPMPLLCAMDRLGVAPVQTLMVGDSRSDIKAAQQAGCKVAAVTYGYNHGVPVSAYQPDIIIDDLAELFS